MIGPLIAAPEREDFLFQRYGNLAAIAAADLPSRWGSTGAARPCLGI